MGTLAKQFTETVTFCSCNLKLSVIKWLCLKRLMTDIF